MNLTITDMNGRPMEVVDLDDAIIQAAYFKDYKHDDPAHAGLDERLKSYWTDIYNKLTAIRERLNNTVNF